jgi:molybdopterin-guanine dinucleotide biosynthesis protein
MNITFREKLIPKLEEKGLSVFTIKMVTQSG